MRFFIAVLFLTLGATYSWGDCSGGVCSRGVLASGASGHAGLGSLGAIGKAEEFIEDADRLGNPSREFMFLAQRADK